MSDQDKNPGLNSVNSTRKDVKEKKKTGRKSKYHVIQQNLTQIYTLYEHGFTDVEVANFYGIKRSTLSDYKKRHKEFSDTIERGKMMADSNVINSLYKKCLGYDYTEEIVESILDDSGKPTKLKAYRKLKKHVPASDGAIKMWLWNRLPQKFRNKLEIDNNIKIPWDKLSTPQLLRIIAGEPVTNVLAEVDGINPN